MVWLQPPVHPELLLLTTNPCLGPLSLSSPYIHKTGVPILTSTPSLCLCSPPHPQKLQAPSSTGCPLAVDFGNEWGLLLSKLFTVFLTRFSVFLDYSVLEAQALAHIIFVCHAPITLIQQILVDRGGRDGWQGVEKTKRHYRHHLMLIFAVSEGGEAYTCGQGIWNQMMPSLEVTKDLRRFISPAISRSFSPWKGKRPKRQVTCLFLVARQLYLDWLYILAFLDFGQNSFWRERLLTAPSLELLFLGRKIYNIFITLKLTFILILNIKLKCNVCKW